MGKQHRPVRLFALGVLALPLAAACGGTLPPDQALARATTDVARVEVVEGRACGVGASVASIPEHCQLSPKTGRSWLLTADVQYVAAVDPGGRASNIRILKAPEGYDLEEAAVECAKQASYSVPLEGDGQVGAETCPVTLRFHRYASDSGHKDPPPIPCPVVQPYTTGTSLPSAGTDCTPR